MKKTGIVGGLWGVIKEACVVDRAGEAILELLLLKPENEIATLGIQNVRELIAITAWYLWWDRRRLVHEGKAQNAQLSSMGIRAITTNYVNAHSPNATS